MYRKLTTVAAVAALAFGLAACGGGGGGDDTSDAPTTMEPMPMPPPTAAVMIPDGMYLNEDNAPSAGMMTIAAGEMATNNGVIFSCPAGGDACEVEVMADGSVTSTGGEATAALSADAMVQVAQAKQDAQDEADRMALENRDRIIGKDRALEAAANLGTGTDTTDSTLDEAEISIARAPGAMASARVTGAVSGFAPAADPALPNGNWRGVHLTRSVTGVGTNHLFVYTDIDPPTRIQFYDFDGDPNTPNLYGGTVTNSLTPAPTDGNPADTATVIAGLTIDSSNASPVTLDLTRFPAPGPAPEGDISQDYAVNDDPGNTGANTHVSIPGNFNGAGGRYTCAATTVADGCTVTVTPGGAYTMGGGTWTFVPELNATAWRQDTEFMSFGWWMHEPNAQTGVYRFRYYADGNVPYVTPTTGNTNLASGSATYTGRAAGKYVVQEIDDTGVIDGEAGMFTAAASLTATFTNSGSAGNISGIINGFQSDNADVDVSGWSVALNRQSFANADGVSTGSTDDPTAAGFDGATATMGDQTAHGTWTSQFFGQPTGNAYPLGVGGTFQADNEAASIAGAFGARR